jgi:hypothetical protein
MTSLKLSTARALPSVGRQPQAPAKSLVRPSCFASTRSHRVKRVSERRTMPIALWKTFHFRFGAFPRRLDSGKSVPSTQKKWKSRPRRTTADGFENCDTEKEYRTMNLLARPTWRKHFAATSPAGHSGFAENAPTRRVPTRPKVMFDTIMHFRAPKSWNGVEIFRDSPANRSVSRSPSRPGDFTPSLSIG